ncbi:MAG TPA: methionyl-tRNA formyltransferase [Pyrinomonadaceae bacterium]|nr:methionyl-tRNA formyltransferase [Pyrinomonadaceae bacterium]
MRIVFMGTPDSAVASLRRLLDDGHEVVAVWTQPDRVSGRGQDRLREPAVKVFALGKGLPVEQPTKIKTKDSKELFASYNADLAVVVAYGRILPGEYLTAPSKGCVNVHFSLLPRYRGAAPVNWAIVKGEQKTGVTTMLVEEELDAGPILLQRETPIAESETAPELMKRLADIGAELLSETLKNFDEIKPQAQDHSNASLAPLLTRTDGLIDWSNPAAAIERAVRGFQPWPNAHTFYKSQRVIVWSAEAIEDAPTTVRPGEVIAANGDDLIAKCSDDTALRLIEVQPEGKRRMSARNFLIGSRPSIGDLFADV